MFFLLFCVANCCDATGEDILFGQKHFRIKRENEAGTWISRQCVLEELEASTFFSKLASSDITIVEDRSYCPVFFGLIACLFLGIDLSDRVYRYMREIPSFNVMDFESLGPTTQVIHWVFLMLKNDIITSQEMEAIEFLYRESTINRRTYDSLKEKRISDV